jgi:hypothetical protein
MCPFVQVPCQSRLCRAGSAYLTHLLYSLLDHSFIISAVDGGEWSVSRSGRFAPVLIGYDEAGGCAEEKNN